MKRSRLLFFALSLLSISLIGCNRGCTTSKTIKSESTTISTSAGNVQIVGRVVDYRHSRRVGSDIFDREVTHTFGLCFDINFGTFQLSEFYHEGVDDPDNVNLTNELKRVKVKISKDQNHIGMGVDGKVVKLVHLYKSHGIGTDRADLVADGTMDWSKLDMESFPSPSEILTKSLEESCDFMPYGTSAMDEFCNDSKPSSKVHKTLLDKWPSCTFAKNYFTEQKVRELAKDKKWKKRAEKRGLKVLKNIESHNFDFEEIAAFVDQLNSSELNEALNEVLMNKWGTSGANDYTEKLVERLKQQNSFTSEERSALYETAKSEFDKFQQTGESNYKREAAECLYVLQAMGDTTTGYNFINTSFGKNVSQYNCFDFIEVAFDHYGSYTDYQQELMLNKTESTFDAIQDYSRSVFYSNIEGIADCSMLKRLQKKYPEDLKMERIPSRCKP